MTSRSLSAAPRLSLPRNFYDYLGYGAMHLACLGIFWTGFSWAAVAVCVGSYVPRMFGLVAGYHRYFAHRSYKMSRPVQFLMALLGSLAVQKGVLWWAEYHRHHHRYPDAPEDVHSPIQRSFAYSHSGWFLDERHRGSDPEKVPDLAAYPELRWLNRWNLLPVVLYAVVLFLAFGWVGLFWGFFLSTILIWHGIHAIGSFGHRFGGYRRFPTVDNSRNKWFLAITTLGEGWHNNHHYYPASARQGFYWYEVDIAWYMLKAMSWLGLVSDLKTPPEHVLRGELLPGYQRRLLQFQEELVELRRRLEVAVDEEVAARLGAAAEPGAKDGGAGLRRATEHFKQWCADRVDRFDEAAYSLLVEGLEERLHALRELRQDIVEVGSRRFEDELDGPALERLRSRLGAELTRFGREPVFLGRGA